MSFSVGSTVRVAGRPELGEPTVAFCGRVSFAEGEWLDCTSPSPMARTTAVCRHALLRCSTKPRPFH